MYLHLLALGLIDGAGEGVTPPSDIPIAVGGFLSQKSYQYRYKAEKKLEDIAPEVARVIKTEAVAHIDNRNQIEVKKALRDLGIDYKNAYQQIYIELVQEMRQAQEDEQIAIAIALMI